MDGNYLRTLRAEDLTIRFGKPRFNATATDPTTVKADANSPMKSGALSTKYVGEDSMIVSSMMCAEAPGMCALVISRRCLKRFASLSASAAISVEPRKSRAGCFELNDAAYPLAAPAIVAPAHASATSNISLQC